MAKLVILALAFTAIVAFAEVSAYTTTTITTSVMEDNVPRRSQSQEQCRRRIQSQQVDHCQMHITEGSSFQDDLIRMPVRQQQPHLQLCCQQLRNVEEECQCEAIKEAFQQAQRQQQQGGRRWGQDQQGGRRGWQGQGERRGWEEQQGGRRWGQEQQGGRRGWQGQQGGGQSMQQQMLRRAEQIPDQCNLRIQQCRIQSGWY
ncbi:hypothetical protein L2E82_37705 [Cichorium intybus]|uniref:Uncharacterized protein n=1 Tax=Cichorium intybus TaxID=13427 RepID=A0ACB9AEY4_CICIN|nr:hypothetical protein L2E82_37705 [Cichorium intybus]